jgi:KDO2-lipid IV(A) lauroyltransferase
MTSADEIAEPRAVEGMTAAELRDLTLYRIMRSLPISAASRAGATLGQFMGRRAHPAVAVRVAASMARLRPDLASNLKTFEAAQVRFWGHVGRIYAEYCVLHKMVPLGRVEIDDRTTFQAVLADGRPLIVPFVHLGNWETCGSMLALSAPGRVCALSNPMPPNRVQSQIALMQHARMPAKVLTFDATVWRGALQHLEQPGGILFVAIDEVMAGRVSTPSLGRPLDPHANVHKIVRIAARTGAIILPLYSQRLPGARFVTRVLPALEFQKQGRIDPDEQLARVLQLDRTYETAVLSLLDQWFGLLDFHP